MIGVAATRPAGASLLDGKNTGNPRFHAGNRSNRRIRQLADQRLARPIPYPSEQGIKSPEQGCKIG
jgi:hypothetical protein